MDTVFHVLGPEQVDELAGVERACFSLPWSRDQLMSILSQTAYRVWGACLGCRLCGYISVFMAGGEMEVVNLAVRIEHRRQGLGGALLDRALAQARACGIERVFLEVRASNEAALALYAKAGFLAVGRRTRYYPDNNEDALVLRKALDRNGLEAEP